MDLSQLLSGSLSHDPTVRREAERALEQLQRQPGFGLLPLQLTGSAGIDKSVKQAAALLYKNYVKANWKSEEEALIAPVPVADRQALKAQVIPVMIGLADQPALQIQIGEAISVMAAADFPEEWSDLVDQLIANLSQDNFVLNNAVLQTAHSIFKRWRAQFRSDSLFLEIKFVLERFCAPYLAIFQRTDELLSSPNPLPSPADPATLAKTLLLLLQIFYDLNSQDLPEFFEDNMNAFMTLLHKYLTWQMPAKTDDDDDEAGEWEKIRASICEIVELYSQRYQDVFPQMDQFVETVWTMVTSLGPGQKYDILVSKAVKFLSVVVKMPGKQALFSADATLESFCERIILPNMALREFEEDLFEEVPLEYLQRDLEGTDSETRRQAAADFTQALMQQFEQQITSIISRYISAYLQQYTTNPKENWKAKDTAIFLLTSIASRSSSSQHGVTSTNALVDIIRFFSEHVVQELQAAPGSTHPIIQADAIKFLYTFRTQLSKDQLLSVLPILAPHLENPAYVIHTYAAITIERILYIKKDGQLMFTQADVRASAESILVALLKVIESGDTPEKIAQNDYLMKCVMRVIITARQSLTPIYSTVLQHLVQILTEVSKNPSNPKFNQFAFESIAALVRFVVAGNPATLPEFEAALFPPFTYILQQDVTEFSPFVFQILSQLLELHTDAMPESYKGLLGPLLMGSLWTQRGNVPALVRLLRAMLAKGSSVIVENNQLGAIKDILRFLNESGKAHDAVTCDLVEGLFENVPVFLMYSAALNTILRDVVIILLTRLMQKRTERWVQGFIKALFTTIAVGREGFGSEELIAAFDGVQPGIFGQVLKAIRPDMQKTPARDRKNVAVGMAKLLTQSERMLSEPNVQEWPATMEALLKLFLLPQDLKTTQDEDVAVVDPDELGYQASFSKLGASEPAKRDPVASIPDARDYLTKSLASASQAKPGRFPALMAAVPEEFRQPFQQHLASAGVTLQ